MSSQPKHTKGPWSRNIKPASHYPIIFAGRNTHVAQVISKGLTTDEIEANCDLIAAAPELLEAAKGMLENYRALKKICNFIAKSDRPNFHTSNEDVHTIAVEKAIAKAEGK